MFLMQTGNCWKMFVSPEKIRKMYQSGVYGFSIARGVISGTLNFDIANF